MDIEVEHLADSHRFVATIGDETVGRLSYSVSDSSTSDSIWVAYSTQVDPEHEGQGVGSALTLACCDAARAAGVKINPSCWFVAGWLDRHPDFEDVRAS